VANELILIVEDNPKNLKLLRDTLQVRSYALSLSGARLLTDESPR